MDRAPTALRLLGYFFTAYAILSGASLIVTDGLSVESVVITALFFAAGWGLLSARPLGYWGAAVIALLHVGGGTYLLTLGKELGEWTRHIGIWLFLLPGLVIAALLLHPASRLWVARRR